MCGLLGLVQAASPRRHAGNADVRQRALDARSVFVARHQHADVARRYRAGPALAVGHDGATGLAIGQQLVDRQYAGGRRLFAHAVDGVVVRIGLQPLEDQPGRDLSVDVQRVIRTGASRRDVLEFNAGLVECAFAIDLEQRLHRLKRDRPGPEVGRQGMPQVCCFLRGQVGRDITATEAIDRLLGVADQEQGARCRTVLRASFGEQAAEDGPLARIGVLEFIHQRDRVLLAQGGGEATLVVGVQCLRHAADHVVEAEHAALVLERVDARRREISRRMHDGDLPAFQGGDARLPGACPGLDGREQRRCRRRLARVGLGQQRARAVVGELVGVRIGFRGVVSPFAKRSPDRVHGAVLAVGRVYFPGGKGISQLRAGLVAVAIERCGEHFAGGTQSSLRFSAGVGRGQRRDRVERQQFAQAVGQLRRRIPDRQQGLGLVRVQRMAAPEFERHFFAQQCFVGEQFTRCERLAGLECVFVQGALAEGMDGVDGRDVHLLDRLAQAQQQRLCAFARYRVAQQLLAERGFGGVAIRRRQGRFECRLLEQLPRLQQALAQLFAKLLGRRLGEGNGQQPRHGNGEFDDQPRIQRRHREGLARTRAGFDQLHAAHRQRQAQIHVQGLSHRLAPRRSRAMSGRLPRRAGRRKPGAQFSRRSG